MPAARMVSASGSILCSGAVGQKVCLKCAYRAGRKIASSFRAASFCMEGNTWL